MILLSVIIDLILGPSRDGLSGLKMRSQTGHLDNASRVHRHKNALTQWSLRGHGISQRFSRPDMSVVMLHAYLPSGHIPVSWNLNISNNKVSVVYWDETKHALRVLDPVL